MDCWYSDLDGPSFMLTNRFDILNETRDLYVEIPTGNKEKHKSAKNLAIAIGSKSIKRAEYQDGPLRTLRNSRNRMYNPYGDTMAALRGEKPFHTIFTGTPQPDNTMTSALTLVHKNMMEGSTKDLYKGSIERGGKRKTKRRSKTHKRKKYIFKKEK